MVKCDIRLSRREFLQYAEGTVLSLAGLSGLTGCDETGPERNSAEKFNNVEYKLRGLPPVRAITKGPKFHWFGYYDKLQFDPSCRYVLGMEVDFEHRSPEADDVIKIGMVDLKDEDRWIELGQSRAWCWQQACMLQWRPSSKTEVLWNNREGDRFVCHILDFQTGKKRTIRHPIYCVSSDGRTAATPDFRRIKDMRPGYGYAGLADPNRNVPAPEDSGIFCIDLETGEAKLIVSIADIAKIPFDKEIFNPYERGDMSGAKHYFNHLLFNTDGSRLEFLHRWRLKTSEQAISGGRMLTCSPEGKDIRVVDGGGQPSHFIWRDSSHILAWAWHPSHELAYYLFEDGSDKIEVVGRGVMVGNGHCSYLPGNKWILNDMYPDRERKQQVYLYNVASGEKVSLGRFYCPVEYTGEWRCDTHPRHSPDGRNVVIDSPHGGSGRQMYLIDISEIVG